MALKDWKRSQTSSGFYKKKGGQLPIFIKFETTEYENNRYLVLYKRGIGGDSVPLRYFKTKLQALKFAKAYMRVH